MPRTIVVVGGALSGPAAAARAREIDETARIVLVERGDQVSYAVGGLAYHLSGEVPTLNSLNRQRAEFFRDAYNIDVKLGVRVTRIDAEGRTVHLDKGRLKYDALIFAAGAASLVPDLPDLEGAKNVRVFRTLADLKAMRTIIDRGGRKVAILGGGFFGVEAADGLSRRKCHVTLVEQGPRLLQQFTATMSGLAESALRESGVKVVTGATVVSAQRRGGRVRSLTLSDGQRIETDLVVAAVGVRPRTELLHDAGAELNTDGSVNVDENCRTSLAGILACGVCVARPHAVSGRPVWLPHAALADKTAQVAGACAAGSDARLGPVLGTAIVRCGPVTLGRTGLELEQARRHAGPALRSIRAEAPSCDVFFPGSTPVSIELFYDGASGRLLGAEVASRSGADKRVDVLATAVAGGLTVEQLALLDLAYASPYSPARDPVNVAGTVAAAAGAGLAQPWPPALVREQQGLLSLVDVSTARARNARTIEGSAAIPLARLRSRLDAIPQTGPLVFVCQNGRESYLAARIAAQRGREVGYLAGGLNAWLAEGHPSVKRTGAKR